VKQNFFKDRTVYYSTFPIQDQAIQGDWNFRLQAVYTVGILDFVFDDRNKDKTVVTDFYDKLTFIYLQMPNFGKTEDELETHFDKWLYVIRNLHRLQDRPAKLQERVFEKLFGLAEIGKFGYEERMAYEDSLKVYRDLKNSLDTAKDEGRAEGREEGEKIGIEKGEKMKALQIAEEMLGNGESVTKISKYTGLSAEEIGLIRQRSILFGICE
jgi:predicted transposase/invertase (TIGR01784 family)